MRTHARYELQDSASVEEPASSHGTDSPLSVGSGLVTSRSLSTESSEHQPQQAGSTMPTGKPPSPMDTEDEKLPGQESGTAHIEDSHHAASKTPLR